MRFDGTKHSARAIGGWLGRDTKIVYGILFTVIGTGPPDRIARCARCPGVLGGPETPTTLSPPRPTTGSPRTTKEYRRADDRCACAHDSFAEYPLGGGDVGRASHQLERAHWVIQRGSAGKVVLERPRRCRAAGAAPRAGRPAPAGSAVAHPAAVAGRSSISTFTVIAQPSNAGRPVMARPMINVWISSVPS